MKSEIVRDLFIINEFWACPLNITLSVTEYLYSVDSDNKERGNKNNINSKTDNIWSKPEALNVDSKVSWMYPTTLGRLVQTQVQWQCLGRSIRYNYCNLCVFLLLFNDILLIIKKRLNILYILRPAAFNMESKFHILLKYTSIFLKIDTTYD